MGSQEYRFQYMHLNGEVYTEGMTLCTAHDFSHVKLIIELASGVSLQVEAPLSQLSDLVIYAEAIKFEFEELEVRSVKYLSFK